MPAVPEAALIGLLNHFRGYEYSLGDARYPYPLSGVPGTPLEPPKTNNCCTFVEALLVRAWSDVHGSAFQWSAERHRQMMIVSTADMFSPVTAIVEAGMGEAIADADALPEPWTIVQGWRRSGETDDAWGGGHTFLILDSHPDTRRVLSLESNKAYRMNGPGFRMHGDLDAFEDQHPGSRWWENEAVWTWEKFRHTYPHMKLAKLDVEDVKWVASSA